MVHRFDRMLINAFRVTLTKILTWLEDATKYKAIIILKQFSSQHCVPEIKLDLLRFLLSLVVFLSQAIWPQSAALLSSFVPGTCELAAFSKVNI